MKHYHIIRTNNVNDIIITVIDDDLEHFDVYELTPEASLKQRNHSPDGFEFGYGGSGPAQLALAILMDFTGKVPHPALYQSFKFKFIATIPRMGGVIRGNTIEEFINEFDGEKFMPSGEKP